MVEGKDYPPSERRFEVANEKKDPIRGRQDDIAYERVEGLKELYWWLRSEIPDICFAFSLFGSLSKGKPLNPKSAESADVDVAMFFDEDDLRENHAKLYAENGTYRRQYDAVNTPDFLQRLPGSLEEKQRKVRSMAMHRYLSIWIQAHSEKFLEGALVHPHPQAISYEGPDSLFTLVENFAGMEQGGKADQRRPVDPEKNPFAYAIARFFHLDVGGGLKEYRQHFLQQISLLDPQTREHFWSVVDRCARGAERDNVIPEKAEKQYPRTFDEAVKYYGLPKW